MSSLRQPHFISRLHAVANGNEDWYHPAMIELEDMVPSTVMVPALLNRPFRDVDANRHDQYLGPTKGSNWLRTEREYASLVAEIEERVCERIQAKRTQENGGGE